MENRALAGSLDGALARLKAGQGFRTTADGDRPLPKLAVHMVAGG